LIQICPQFDLITEKIWVPDLSVAFVVGDESRFRKGLKYILSPMDEPRGCIDREVTQNINLLKPIFCDKRSDRWVIF